MNELRNELINIDNIINEVENISYYLEDEEEKQLFTLLDKIKGEILDFLSIEELASISKY